MPSTAGVRAHYTAGGDAEDRELHVWGGILSARISDIAEAIGATPEEVAQAAESKAVETMMDTAEPKGYRTDEDRPTDPELRSIALTEEQFDALRNEVEATG